VEALEKREILAASGAGCPSCRPETAYLQYAAITTETRSGRDPRADRRPRFQPLRFDRTRSTRDLGSAFEPFVAAAAAERGKLVLPGRPVQTGRQIGPAEVERIAKRCGIGGPFVQAEDLFRGAVAATPMEMSVGLATLGNKGKRPKPYFIREIRDASRRGDLHRQTPAHPGDQRACRDGCHQRAAPQPEAPAPSPGPPAPSATHGRCASAPAAPPPSGSASTNPPPSLPNPRLKSLLDEFVKRLGNE
jgi:membrane peptidoglycan carboxypeptidase